MTTGRELIFGAYEHEADGVLHLVATGQRLITATMLSLGEPTVAERTRSGRLYAFTSRMVIAR